MILNPAPYSPLRYLPADADMTDWETQRPYWEELQARALPDAEALQLWIRDWGELADAVQEIGGRLDIATYRDTRDADMEAAKGEFLEQVEPKLAVAMDGLGRRLIAHPDVSSLSVDHGKW